VAGGVNALTTGVLPAVAAARTQARGRAPAKGGSALALLAAAWLPEDEALALLQQLQQRLGCGTQCGSCVPTLQRLVAATPQPLASQAA
jgi:hypothetical protein